MRTTTPTFLVLACALLGALPAAAAGRMIFQLDDPRGDDHGDGALVYPLARDFERGDLDLIAFSARRDGDGTLFEAIFARPVRTPEGEAIDQLGTQLADVARLGFYTFNLDVYIDLDREPGSGGVGMLPGRRAEVHPDFAWDRAVVLTPRPSTARGELKRMIARSVKQAVEEQPGTAGSEEAEAQLEGLKARIPEDVETRIFFPTRVQVRGPKVTFFVPADFLGGTAQPEWAYVVVVSGADIRQSFDLTSLIGVGEETRDRLMILPRGVGTWSDRFGGGRKGDELQTPLVDVVVPAGTTQERLLSDYDVRQGVPVRLPGVVPAAGGGETGKAGGGGR